jgi:hypothetical protein
MNAAVLHRRSGAFKPPQHMIDDAAGTIEAGATVNQHRLRKPAIGGPGGVKLLIGERLGLTVGRWDVRDSETGVRIVPNESTG